MELNLDDAVKHARAVAIKYEHPFMLADEVERLVRRRLTHCETLNEDEIGRLIVDAAETVEEQLAPRRAREESAQIEEDLAKMASGRPASALLIFKGLA